MTTALVLTFSVASLVCGVWVLIKLIHKFVAFKKWKNNLSRLPTRNAHWLLGDIKEYGGQNETGLKFQRENVGRFPKVFVFWMGQFTSVVSFWHPDTLRLILKSSEPKARMLYGMISPWVGDGLLVSKGRKWARNRRLLTPAFHFEILKPYINIKSKTAEILLGKISDYAKRGEYFDICPLATLFTLDVILQCAFSYNSDCQTLGKKLPYVASIDKLSELILNRLLNPLLYSDFVYSLTKNGREFKRHCDYVHQVSTDIIHQRRKILEDARTEGKEQKRYLDFLDILLTARDDEGLGLSDPEIRDEVDTFLFEGHDTTASALYWTIFSIAGHPEHQSRIQEELDDILKDRKSDDIQWEDLAKMSYLTMCLKEAIRLHTPVPFGERELTQPLEVEGVTLSPGTIVEIGIYSAHHNPHVWDDPMEYRPDRFSPENIDKRDPFAFIPFSAGSRNCIGQTFAMNELKVILAKIFSRFNLEVDPYHKVEKKIGLVMKTENGIRLRARQRHPFV